MNVVFYVDCTKTVEDQLDHFKPAKTHQLKFLLLNIVTFGFILLGISKVMHVVQLVIFNEI